MVSQGPNRRKTPFPLTLLATLASAAQGTVGLLAARTCCLTDVQLVLCCKAAFQLVLLQGLIPSQVQGSTFAFLPLLSFLRLLSVHLPNLPKCL